MKYLLSFFLLIFVGCSQNPSKMDHLEERISKIPSADQQKLETLFQRMMTGDYFACTLFGNKPMTFQEFHDDPWKLSSYAMVNPYNHFYLDEGWKTWVKYRDFFPSERFIFTKLPSILDGYDLLLLINKAAFKNMFNANRDLFEEALGSNITAEKIFQNFEGKQKTFDQVLNSHEGLVGLVLGYGRKGSMQAYHDWALMRQILRNSLYPLSPSMEENKLPRSLQISLKFQEKKLIQRGTKWHQLHFDVEPAKDPYAELNKNNQTHEFLLPPWQEIITHILPPNFSCIKGSIEAVELKEEYSHAMQIARETFKTKSFLRGFLEQYCEQEN